MKIINLQARNVKRLSVVEIDSDGKSVIVIGGKNGAGKSSVLDAIMYALGGKRSMPSEPVRHGETDASVSVKLRGRDGKEMIVTRNMSPNGGSIQVTNGDGAKFSSPQKLLDDLYNALTFDPVEFERMSPKDQVETLKRVAGVEEAYQELTDLRTAVYAQRTDTNRDIKRLVGQVNAVDIPEDTPDQYIDTDDLINTRSELEKQMAAHMEAKHTVERLKSDITAKQQQLSNIDSVIAKVTQELAEAKAHRSELEAQLADACSNADDWVAHVENFDAPDLPSIDQKIRDSLKVNEAVDTKKRHLATQDELAESVALANEQTEAIEGYDRQRIELIANATLPISGLALTESGVTYNGVPFDQCSSAERLRVSVAMGMATNSELRVMLIRDGSLMDDDSLAAVREMAESDDYQCWIERVGSDEQTSIIIEDGHIQGVETPNEEPAFA